MVGNGEAKVLEWDEIQPLTVRVKLSLIKAMDELIKNTTYKSRNDIIEVIIREWAQNKVVSMNYKDLDSFILELKQKLQEQVPQVEKETTQQLDSV